MDALTRRRFLRASGVAGAGALALGAGALGLAELLSAEAEADSAPILVLVTLYGGNDGLNTVIPYTDPAYYSARPELAYPAEEVLRLDDKLGLNPKLTGFKRLWEEKRLGIVLGVGYPKPDRSHFRSMDIWQTGSPAVPIHTGWVGRWLDSTSAAPEAAVTFEPVLPPLLVGANRTGACVSLSGLQLPTGITYEMLASFGKQSGTDTALQARAASGYSDLLRVERLIREAERGGGAPVAGPGSDDLPATGTGGQGALAPQLEMVSRCIEAGVPTRVYSVSLGGFDTHAQERAGHERLLKLLDSGLTAFADRMAKSVAGRQVVVVVYSEFGRRVRGNASSGTDHGTAGPMFLIGRGIAAGFHGEQPSLSDLDDGDLKAGTDFRDVIGAVIASVLHTDPNQYFDGYKMRDLPVLQSA